ncbi:MAG: molybdopterin-synthase adenylyltransferase MoeB [Thermoanaerobaculia bacterium]
MLTSSDKSRYSRQITLPEIGEQGQEALSKASVLIVGAGGLGSPAALYLAAAGVGTIGLVDFDAVDITNLHRQILYDTDDVGSRKVDAARNRLAGLNPTIRIVTHDAALTSENALDVLRDYQIIVDGTDNFPTRYLVNDACVLLGKVNVYGSIFRFDGQVSVFDARSGPCYRCLYPEPPPPNLIPSCAEGGVLGVLPGVIGTLQAIEAIKLITGVGEPLIGRLLLFDALQTSFRTLRLKKDPNCSICGAHPTIRQLIDYEGFCNPRHSSEITAAELSSRLGQVVLIDVRERHEFAAGHLDGAKLLPLSELPQRMIDIPTDRDVVLYCQSGSRSARAQQLMQEAGFTRVRNLAGGFAGWQRR